jgi:tRNA pseudouridine55 synthase
MATGLLVLAVGQGTKLVPYLSGVDKEYQAVVALGRETDTLDAQGQVTEEGDVPSLSPADVQRAADAFRGWTWQRPPAVSAIKVGGTALHERVRRGESVQPEPRRVELHRIGVGSVQDGRIGLHVHCGKGFYVRSLARDLARALGTVGHLVELRRIRVGGLSLEVACDWASLEDAAGGDAQAREHVQGRVLSLEQACGHFPRVALTPQGVEDARHGRRITPERGIAAELPQVDGDTILALVGPEGNLIALGQRDRSQVRVVRGFPER